MNPKAIKYYKKWLRRRGGTWRSWLVLWLLVSAGLGGLVLTADFISGRFEGTMKVIFVVILPVVALTLFAVYAGSRTGSWILLENTERIENGGQHLLAWRELMIKYRGFIPSVVAGERFHRLLVAVTEGISVREDLTVDQAREISELLSLARNNLARPGGATPTPGFARFARQAAIALLWLTLVVTVVRFLLIFLDARD